MSVAFKTILLPVALTGPLLALPLLASEAVFICFLKFLAYKDCR
jgi:hypothetical protein